MLVFSDIRLLPPSYQGASITSNEINGLTLQGGHLSSTSLRNEAGDEKMQAMLGHVPQRQVSSDGFNFAGADYAFNDKRSSVSAWYGQLEDIYNQRFLGLKHSEPVGDWILGANLGYFDSREDGKKLLGNIDNQAFFSLAVGQAWRPHVLCRLSGHVRRQRVPTGVRQHLTAGQRSADLRVRLHRRTLLAGALRLRLRRPRCTGA